MMKKRIVSLLLLLLFCMTVSQYPVSADGGYRLTYRAGDGRGTVDPVLCPAGESVTLAWPDELIPPEGKAFAGWKCGNTVYQPGAVFRPTADTEFTAAWQAPVTIYINPSSGSPSASGLSPEAAVPDLSAAFGKIKGLIGTSGSPYSNTFVLCEPLTTSPKGTTITVPLTLTALGGGETDGNETAMFSLGGTLLCKNAVWFRDLSMQDTGTHNLCGCGNPLRFSGISTQEGASTAATLVGAGSSMNYAGGGEGSTAAADTSLRLESGAFNVVYGGGLTVAARDTHVEINGASVNYLYGGGNTADVTGNITLTVNGGSVTSLIAGGNQSGAAGKASVFINGGTVSGIQTGCALGTKTVAGGTTVGCSGEFIPVSYTAGSGAGIITPELQYRFGDTLRLEYPFGLSGGEQEFYAWKLGDALYSPGDAFATGDTYLSFAAEWREPVSVYVDQTAGSDANPGTRERPVRSVAAANALLRDRAAGGSVYTNRIVLCGTYMVSGAEETGLNPCCLTGGELVLLDGPLKVTADLRLACAISGTGKVSIGAEGEERHGHLCVDSAEAVIAEVECYGEAVCVRRGNVRYVRGTADLNICGGTVQNVMSARDIRLSAGTLGFLKNADRLTVTGGTLGTSTGVPKDFFLRRGRTATLTAPVIADTLTGGGTIVFAENALLTLRTAPTGTTAADTQAMPSDTAVICCEGGADADAFSGDLVFDGKGTYKTALYAVYHLGTVTGRLPVAEDGSFTLPQDPIADGYSFRGWFLDEAHTVPYTYAPTSVPLELFGDGGENAPAELRINATGGTVLFRGTGYCTGNYNGESVFPLYRGATVVLKAEETSSRVFLYWLDDASGRILSREKEYSFRLAEDTRIAAVFGSGASGPYTVTFVGEGNRVLASVQVKRSEALPADSIPDAAALVPGSRFTGWDRDLTAPVTGHMTVCAQYEAVNASVRTTEPASDSAPARITRVLAARNSVTFVADWQIPEGCALLRAGIAVSSPDGKFVCRGEAESRESTGSWYLTKGCAGGTVWQAVPYVIYAAQDGSVTEVRGTPVTASCEAEALAETGSPVRYTVTLDGGLSVETSMREFYKSVVDTSKEKYTYDEMEEDLRLLAARFPDRMRLCSIGKSVLGRELYTVEIGNPEAPYRMFVKATDHAREWINTVIVMKQIEFYLENWNNSLAGERVSEIFDTVCLCFEPMANPDGVMLSQEGLSSIADAELRARYAELLSPLMQKEQAGMVRGVDYDDDLDITALCDENGIWWGRWAANINGVDLHRDYYEEGLAMYNAAFRTYVSKHRTPDSKDAFGKSGLSQPETRAVAEYIAKTGFNLSLSYHSYSPCLQLPVALSPEAQLEKNQVLIGVLSGITGYNLNSNTGTLSKDAVNAGYNNWFVCRYPSSACFTVETGYKEIGGHSDNTPLKMAQLPRLFAQNKYGPLYLAMYARDHRSVGAPGAR